MHEHRKDPFVGGSSPQFWKWGLPFAIELFKGSFYQSILPSLHSQICIDKLRCGYNSDMIPYSALAKFDPKYRDILNLQSLIPKESEIYIYHIRFSVYTWGFCRWECLQYIWWHVKPSMATTIAHKHGGITQYIADKHGEKVEIRKVATPSNCN